jgi:hypothetical protein
MKNSAQKATDMRLYVDSSGVAWFVTSNDPWKAHASEISVSKFVEQALVRDAGRIRILGNRPSAALICALYEAREADPGRMPPCIQIGTPALISSEVRDDPTSVVALMNDLQLPSSCGGWHEMTRHDYRMYGLVHHAQTETMTQDLSELLEMHPAYPAISFVPTFDALNAAKLLAEIVDPRWFIDPAKPDRTSRLRNYMGMRPRVLKQTFDGHSSPHCRRARIAMRAWSTGDYSTADLTHPASFLFRIVRDSSTKEKGMLNATVRYLNFVRAVWLDSIAPKGRTLFVPEYFFAQYPDTAKEYVAHLKRNARSDS